MTEQEVSVGILRAERIRVSFHGSYTCGGQTFNSDCEFGMADTGKTFHPSSNECSFTLRDVVIGIGFHWERREDQTFRGALALIDEGGMLRAVNIVPIETYLTSVISSEMSATASLELLKAHAVISRSWLKRQQISAKQLSTQQFSTKQLSAKQLSTNRLSAESADSSAPETLSPPTPHTPNTLLTLSSSPTPLILKWYDAESHTLFDVCADDHCQRYQGITRQTNPNVERAIEATRGEVLMCEGEICDARFSKCCGGTLETFENCWEDAPKPYLVGKEDIVKSEITRNHAVDNAYCNTTDKRILSQVLNGYDQETVNFYRWTVRYTQDELSNLVRRKSGIDFGRILDLVPMQRGESGRIVLLKIIGEARTVTVGKELEIRKWLSDSHLYSSAFDVERDSNGAFVLRGKGWGHGVGLCQIGAAVMGERGFTYKEILQHYYPNTTIEQLW